jgi:hypothetical protein
LAIEGLKIVIGADVNSAVQPLQKVTKSLQDVEKQLADTLASGDDFAKSLDDIVKEGNVAGGIINFLSKEISDFKKAFANATTTEDIQKFGAALQILQDKQNQVIQSGFAAGRSLDEIGHHSATNTVATQRLSSSLLGLNKVFDILPPELAHATHGFDQLIQGFERVTHGTEGAGDKVLKFAGVLGEVGLGIAISVAIGLLVDFTKELLNSDAALEKATEEGIRFEQAISKIDKSIEDSKENLKFIAELGDLNIDINFGKGFQGDLLKLQAGFIDLQGEAVTLETKLGEARTLANEAFKSFQDGISDDARAITGGFNLITQVPDELIKGLSEADKTLIKNAKATQAEFDKINAQITANSKAQGIQAAKNRLLRTDKEREDEKKHNDELAKLLESRNNILEEFRAKFAAIKLPLPLFDTQIKAIPLGKVNDKLLREFLQGTHKVFENQIKNIATGVVDPLTLPIDVHPKAEITGKTQLVQDIENQFGDINKEIENAVNKGIIDVPVDFKVSEGGDGQALKVLEDRINKFVSDIESLTGQRNARLDIDSEFLAHLDPKSAQDELAKVVSQLNTIADGLHPVVHIDAEGKVKITTDASKVAEDLTKEINNSLQTFATDVFVGFGEALGDALSQTFDGNGAKAIFTALSGLLSAVGKALIKAGVLYSGIGKALKAFAAGNPALAIGLGIALVALARVLSNDIGKQAARASGGPVMGGETYRVNEQGREMFVPNGGQPQWLGRDQQYFTPPSPGKIMPAWMAKQWAMKMRMPALEGGGAITGPTFALIGEGFGISASNPEVVAPFTAIKNLLGFNNDTQQTTRSIIRGKDLVLLHNRQNRSDARLT